MAQFSKNTPLNISDLSKLRKESKLLKYNKPMGKIANQNHFEYGYNGDDCYYVTHSYGIYMTSAKLSLEEAKNIYLALVWENLHSELDPKQVTQMVKDARKKKLENRDLFWFFLKTLFPS
jgi:hypothetical protein